MFPTIYSFPPPETLLAYLDAAEKEKITFRRRAVLTKYDDNSWVLVCCTVEALPRDTPPPMPSRYYGHTILYEDILSAAECRAFLNDLEERTLTFGECVATSSMKQQWEIDLVPLENTYMKRAGRVARSRFPVNRNWRPNGPLVAKNLPFYADTHEAVRDWLPFTTYAGESDGRNHTVIFLLPEFRAAFTGATFDNGDVELIVEGTDITQRPFFVKGSFWSDGALSHFDVPVKDGKVFIKAPREADQLTYVLLDSQGEVYDFQREDRFRDTGLGRKRLRIGDQDLAQQVRNAALEGEGSQTEFKPFIDPEQPMGDRDKKTKLRELVTTVVAFANTQGGRIFIGIDDDCGLTDISPKLQALAKTDVTDQTVERYCGALRSRIKDLISKDVTVRILPARVDGSLVLIVDVTQVALDERPVMLRNDKAFYVRAGASNMQLPADHWADVLARPRQVGAFPAG